MISEKEMEDAIVRNPSKYLGEEGLQLVARQFSIGNYRFDLLFEDRHGGKLIVELQRGILDRTHMFKILDYCDEFRDRNPTEFVEPMVIANIIPPERKRRLSNSGIPFREIPEIEFTGGMLPKSDEGVALKGMPNGGKAKQNAITNSSIDAPAIADFKVTGYSSAERNDLMSAYLCFCDVFLPRKIKKESEAQEILRQFRGKYTVEILDKVFDLADRHSGGFWFGQMLSIPNRKRLYHCPMEELNILIDKLIETGDLGRLSQWRRTGNRGMKAGAATLLMYLYSPDSYNVWLPITHRGLSKLYRLDFEYPNKELSSEEYTIFYKRFNETAIAGREENGLVPQAVDWFLWAVDTIKERPWNLKVGECFKGRKK